MSMLILKSSLKNSDFKLSLVFRGALFNTMGNARGLMTLGGFVLKLHEYYKTEA